MKKKFILFILIFTISLCIIPRQKAFASTSYSDVISNLTSNYNNVYMLRYHVTNSWYNGYGNNFTSAGYHVLLIGENYPRDIVIANGYPIIYYNSNKYPHHSYSSTQYSDQFNEQGGYFNCYPSSTYYPDSNKVDYQVLVLIKGSFNNHPDNSNVFYDYDDFIDSITPKWYETLYQSFIDYLNEFGLDNPGLLGLVDWFSDLWTVKVGEGEGEQTIDIITPTPTPTPLPTPTPIPYQTQLVPDGNGGYNITYIFNDPSGIPTSAPQPPTNQPQQTQSVNNDDDWEYPYYNNPNNKDDPFKLDIPWYLKFTFKNTVTSLDDFQDGMDAIVENVNDQDDNINIVMDSMGLFPNDWLLIIGFIAAMPLVGGLISRLLKG